MVDFPALTHVALTVSDLERSRAWYGGLFGSDPVLDEDAGAFHHVVWLIGGTLLGIHEHPGLESSEPFSELRPGLDHVAFGCASRSDLEDWEARLGELGVTTSGIVDAPYGSGLSFRDPDNIALEFFAPRGP
ncbi:MAG: glyoxalase [Acidimicrobiales bacterium]|nr:glyoxalase [Acidimicrobiales bacterium]